ncbi:MAG: aminodeoxychorismate/anthranilate synthase component II [Bacteroidia bacterium]|nr:aminodeoxychorismate/anthranilate synthase component II [Bacteroidia bacterium]
MKKIVIIDNYDSFTYNLLQLVEEVNHSEPVIMKNDLLDSDVLDNCDYLMISPGPGLPDQSGKLMACLKKYYSEKKILGICLGMQAIAELFGCKLRQLDRVFHGIETNIISVNGGSPLFRGIQDGFKAGRYHSWVVEENQQNPELIFDSTDSDGEVMSLRHWHYPVFGVQFHPESFMTPDGEKIIRNFLNL